MLICGSSNIMPNWVVVYYNSDNSYIVYKEKNLKPKKNVVKSTFNGHEFLGFIIGKFGKFCNSFLII